MLSILIPVYNFDVRNFITSIHKQCREEIIEFEIILIDDASENKYITINRELSKLPNVKYIQSEQNIGRSKIRNLLAVKAKYEYLLFADCDMKISNPNFISNYIKHLNTERIICGGISYSEKPPLTRDLFLRWHYGNEREKSSEEKRNKSPYSSFMTGNFLIPKKIFNQIKFNENLVNYGHEDTLFGIELQRQGISVLHINNPLEHKGLENTDQFISKTEKGILNLVYLIRNYNYPELYNNIKLLRAYKKTEHFSFIFKILLFLFGKLMKNNFNSRFPSLKLFDIYKLSYLHKIASIK